MRKPADYLSRRRQKFIEKWAPVWNRVRLQQQWCFRKPGMHQHGNAPLVVSLTSYPARFPTLHLTLKSLLIQTLQPDHLVLWVAHSDADKLPDAVSRLTRYGLQIRYCDDLRSYKKIIPSLKAFSGADLVTADDDVYYWPTWLEELVSAGRNTPHDIVGHRVHRMKVTKGRVAPYRDWTMNFNAVAPHPHNFATGIGGVLYPAGSFHPDVADESLFMRLCPSADDVWLYWMVRMNGRMVRHSGTKHVPRPWRSSQKTSLWKKNKHANDEQIQAMLETYGLP